MMSMSEWIGVLLEDKEFRGGGKQNVISARLDFFQRRWKIDVLTVQGGQLIEAAGVEILPET